MTVATGGQGVAFQYREVTGELSRHSAGPARSAPTWVRVERRGSEVSGWASADGVAWTRINGAALALPDAVWAGLVLTSHDSARAATATFSQVTITGGSAAAN